MAQLMPLLASVCKAMIQMFVQVYQSVIERQSSPDVTLWTAALDQ